MSTSFPPQALISYLVARSGLSKMEVSRRIGRGQSFLGNYTNANRGGKKSIPSIALLASVAKVCGYEVHIIGHGEDITVEVADD